MAAFAISQGASENAAGTILTFEDKSNWTDNTEGYERVNFVRTFTLTDAYDETIDTLILPTDEDTITYTLPSETKFIWVNSVFTIEGAEDYTDTKKYPFYRQVKNMYRTLLKNGCCGKGNDEEALNGADRFFRGADIESISGNASGYMIDITSAYSYLNI